ncbi:MAG: NAD(+) diphosphatase [Oscillospiraceae bacterium]|nr:NAD(+) diphosphatase [Oscillospiraceae bacterium]
MIQDIAPSRLDNSWQAKQPQPDSILMCFRDGRLSAAVTDGELQFPRLKDIGGQCETAVFLFSIDNEDFFLADTAGPNDYSYYSMRELRDQCTGKYLYAAFTAYHLHIWYADNRYCGICRGKMQQDSAERALICTECGHRIYPRINPAVIVGVISHGRILITRYRRGYAHNALVAGFTEIGETLEETVAREVMEETGLCVRNIRYYKSQPWGMAQDILMGFFCEADGDDLIRMDENELKSAVWCKPDMIELQPQQHSLTNEMMQLFRDTNGHLPPKIFTRMPDVLPDRTRIYFTRHGETDMNVENHVSGVTDCALTENGIMQAQQLAAVCAEQGDIELILCSPLKRARRTAEIVAAQIHVPIVTDERLREWNYGSYEGQPRGGSPEFQAAKREFGVRMKDGGESLLQLAHRVYSCIDDIRKQYAGMTVLCVCHGGVCRVAETYFKDMTTDAFSHFFMGNCELRRYEL